MLRQEENMIRKVMVILADGCEEGEAATLIDVMRRAGFQCDGVSISGEIVTCQHGCRLLADIVMGDDLELFKQYDAMVLPGGWRAADIMGEDLRILDLIRHFAGSPDKYLAAMCAAPGVLARAGVTRGKRLTSYPAKILEKMFADAHYVTDTVAFDDERHLITSRGPAMALPFAFAVVDALGGDSALIKSRFLYKELKNYQD